MYEYDIKGLEAFSSYHTPKQIRFYLNHVNKHNLLVSAGSDFHGKTKPSGFIGATHCFDTTDLYYAIYKLLNE